MLAAGNGAVGAGWLGQPFLTDATAVAVALVVAVAVAAVVVAELPASPPLAFAVRPQAANSSANTILPMKSARVIALHPPLSLQIIVSFC
jgi:hypothetical protein